MNPIATLLRSAVARACLSVLPAVAAVALCAPAAAQLGGKSSFAKKFRPDILQRDITLINSVLQLEDWQRPIVEALMQDYATSFNTGLESLKDRMKEAAQNATRANPANADAILDGVMKPMADWTDERRRMSDRFLTDLKNQLGPQQLERWDTFERALRRERMLPDGDLSGEGVDLWSVMARMSLTPAEQEAAAAAIGEYEIALDAALVGREREIDGIEGKLADAMRANDIDAMAREQQQIMVYRVKVRDTNDAAIETIAAAIGDRGAEFRRRALEAGYPEVFRIHPVTVLFQQAREIQGLGDEQRAQVEALAAEFAAVSAEEDLKMLKAVRAEEPGAPRRRAEARKAQRDAGAPGAGGVADDPIVKARVEKEKAGQPFRDRLMALLTPEQQAMLPGGIKVDPAGLERVNEGRPKGTMIGGVEQAADGAAQADDARRSPIRDPRSAPGSPEPRAEPAPAPEPAPEPAPGA